MPVTGGDESSSRSFSMDEGGGAVVVDALVPAGPTAPSTVVVGEPEGAAGTEVPAPEDGGVVDGVDPAGGEVVVVVGVAVDVVVVVVVVVVEVVVATGTEPITFTSSMVTR